MEGVELAHGGSVTRGANRRSPIMFHIKNTHLFGHLESKHFDTICAYFDFFNSPVKSSQKVKFLLIWDICCPLMIINLVHLPASFSVSALREKWLKMRRNKSFQSIFFKFDCIFINVANFSNFSNVIASFT